MTRVLRRVLGAAFLVLALGACGFKGDLVLPEKETPALPDTAKQPSDTDPEAG